MFSSKKSIFLHSLNTFSLFHLFRASRLHMEICLPFPSTFSFEWYLCNCIYLPVVQRDKKIAASLHLLGSVGWALSHQTKGHWFNPWFRAHGWVVGQALGWGAFRKQLTSVCLPSFPSLKIKKILKKIDSSQKLSESLPTCISNIKHLLRNQNLPAIGPRLRAWSWLALTW